MKSEKAYLYFQILKEIASSTVNGQDYNELVYNALVKTSEALGLHAGLLVLWDDNYQIQTKVAFDLDEKYQTYLDDLENDLFNDLRRRKNLLSAYVSLGGSAPLAGFTLPLRSKQKVFGALIGIQLNSHTLVGNDEFLSALSDSLSLVIVNSQINQIVESEKIRLKDATAVRLNHDINNILQDISGIAELTLKDAPEENSELILKMESVANSIDNISRFIKIFTRMTEIKYTEYIDGVEMLDLPDDDE